MPAWYGTLVARSRVPVLMSEVSASPAGKCSIKVGGRKYVTCSGFKVSHSSLHGMDASNVATPPVYEQTSSPRPVVQLEDETRGSKTTSECRSIP